MDVDAAAVANAPAWRSRGDDACEGDDERARFRTACASTLVGTNVDAGKLAHFRTLDPPRIVSTVAFRRAMDGPDGETQVYGGAWGPRRGAFEDGVGARGSAVYGTLDLHGCPGDDKYGAYRLCYDPIPSRPIVLPHNSALVYGDGGEFQEGLFRGDVARWNERAEVATVVHGDDARDCPEAAWPHLLAQPGADDDLLEVVLLGAAPALGDLRAIRVSEVYQTAALQGAFETLAALGVREPDKAVILAARLAEETERAELDGIDSVPLIEVPEVS